MYVYYYISCTKIKTASKWDEIYVIICKWFNTLVCFVFNFYFILATIQIKFETYIIAKLKFRMYLS